MVTSRNKVGFTTKHVCQISGVSARQLNYWRQKGLIKDSASGTRRNSQDRLYNVRDVLNVLVIKELRQKGLSLQKIRESVNRVKKMWGNEQPLAQLRVACLAHSILFRKDGAYIDAMSGQQVIDVALDRIRSKVEPKRCGQTKRMVERQKELFLLKISEM